MSGLEKVRRDIYSLALSNRAKVAIGLNPAIPSAEIVRNSALFAKKEGYASPILVSGHNPSDSGSTEEVPVLVSDNPEKTLVSLLNACKVDAAVRGNLSAGRLLPLLRSTFRCKTLYRIALMEIKGRMVLLAPVGIDEGDTLEDLVKFANYGMGISKLLGMPYKVGVISGGRLEDKGRSPKVDLLLSLSNDLTIKLRGLGLEALNFGIEIESALESGASILLAPDGIIGNIIFRSLVLVANIDSFGAYASTLPKTYIDTSRAKSSYLLPIVFASALARRYSGTNLMESDPK